MNKKTAYILLAVLGVLFACVVILSYSGKSKKNNAGDFLPSGISFNYKDKRAYGSYVAFNLLKQYFREESPTIVKRSIEKQMNLTPETERNCLYLVVAKTFYGTKTDATYLSTYVSLGNTAFIAATDPGARLAQEFGFDYRSAILDLGMRDTSQGFVNENLQPNFFHYDGYVSRGYFSKLDSSVTTIIGTNSEGRPNFIRMARGNGYIYISLNPVVFSNYFLLHGNNHQALAYMMASISGNTRKIYWDEYYKYKTSADSESEFSPWQVLMKHSTFRWALWLLIALLVAFVIFEGKRRQRIIPVVAPNNNSSLDFANTLGKLYYSHHNNANLARKMCVHFLEFVRSKYFISTQKLDEEFVRTLSRKSNYALADTDALVALVKDLRHCEQLSDTLLAHFYNLTFEFYQNAQ
ncbi:hypothetical protein LX64_03887 [Chitinophaga skermanii]|uniref:DUF4350 domain-containing protein n=1 Tax=Chitinophaga skermanii TaxID=331697 RepID=A0A327QAW0_9BACT|nr:DUF4350 domain-containing protein [Chitinophaga skermanii]RAJ01669.1 hypothetical protein LX64_03887 [Chitinophaga skermanii]